jgi:hypothetical protein
MLGDELWDLKGARTTISISPASWWFSGPWQIIDPWPSHSATSPSVGGSACRDEFDKDVELMVLHDKVRILEHQVHGRVRYRRADPAILAAVSPLLPRCRWRFFLVTPETLLLWHREMSKRKWRRWRGPSHPPLPEGVVELILRLGRENRSWGCVRIQRELRGIGF